MTQNSNAGEAVCQADQPPYLTVEHGGQEYRMKWQASKGKYRLRLNHLKNGRDTYYGPDPTEAVRDAVRRLQTDLSADAPSIVVTLPKNLAYSHAGIEYTLTLHKSGQYRRKFAGKDKFFGATPETAKADFYARIAGILIGKDPRFTPAAEQPIDEFDLTFNAMTDEALAYRKSRVGIDLGEDRFYGLEKRFGTLKTIAGKVETQAVNARHVRTLAQTKASEIKDTHVQAMIEKLRETHNLTTLDDDLQYLRFIFGRVNKRIKSDTLELMIKETLASVPQEKKRAEQKRNQKWYSREEILALFHKADPQWKAMILLGINGAMEPIEISMLDWSDVDFELGWFGKSRHKIEGTENAPRLFWYWPETVDALSTQPTRLRGGLVFETSRGEPWVKGKKRSFQKEWTILETEAKVTHIPNRGFKGLRHSFNTFADKCIVKQDFCMRLIMGHAQRQGDMGRVYNGQADDFMVRHYCEFVREWVFSGERAAHQLTHKWQRGEGKLWMDMQFQGVA